MSAFPSLKINTIETEVIKPVLTASYDGGYEQTRRKYTRTTRRFKIGFTALTNANALILEEFFEANQALDFTFTHPITNNTHTVRFDGNSLSFKQDTPLYQSVSFSLKEV